ncbi:molecular chaperone [Photobacterium angustum]|uniref:fimbrial biogenesis chaperone n=1 Tax=Photobacterium angustum TaxID=661 RepID=UPI0005EB65CA|nr:molecular chaperone [Photobacterium angustum]PSW89556.1 molecular chaperone [Photobacterium angustum]
MMKFKKIKAVLLLSLLAPICSYAGGVSLGATRVIFKESNSQQSLNINNSDQDNKFLIQSWIENDKGEKTNDFTITPPLFVVDKNTENKIRIIRVKDSAAFEPKKEQVYWINVKAIPPKDEKKKNTLQLAIVSRIKMFYRPDYVAHAAGMVDVPLQAKYKDSRHIELVNDSIFHQSLINVKTGKNKPQAIMLAPKSTTSFDCNDCKNTNLQYQSINDYGAISDKLTLKVM